MCSITVTVTSTIHTETVSMYFSHCVGCPSRSQWVLLRACSVWDAYCVKAFGKHKRFWYENAWQKCNTSQIRQNEDSSWHEADTRRQSNREDLASLKCKVRITGMILLFHTNIVDSSWKEANRGFRISGNSFIGRMEHAPTRRGKRIVAVRDGRLFRDQRLPRIVTSHYELLQS